MMSWPVVNAAPGELSQSTALAISSGVPMRPAGVCVVIVFFMSVSPSPKVRSNISVWIGPGRDTVNADALLGEFQRSRLGEANDGELAGDVNRRTGKANVPADGNY
jgi:hypothetical protein